MKNARFWEWHNGGWVKLTLAPRQVIETSSSGPTDEGYRSERTSWEHDGARVVRCYASCERDCDGTTRDYGSDVVSLDRLAWVEGMDCYGQGNGILRPEWRIASHGRRDMSAEKAGY